jgi:hypothetical protein
MQSGKIFEATAENAVFLETKGRSGFRSDTDRYHAMCGIGGEYARFLQSSNIIIEQPKSARHQILTHGVPSQLPQTHYWNLAEMGWRLDCSSANINYF